jgi:hypothetical protein
MGGIEGAGRLTRLERRVVLVGGLLAGAGALLGAVGGRGQDKHPQPAAGIETIEIDAWPIAHFERERPETKRFGPLEFRGGLELSSASASFGGWSGLVMEPDGRRLLAISDVGTWMTAELAYDGQRPVGLANARLGPILDSRGRPLKRKADADAEAVALLEGNLQDGMMLIGFERNHRVMRYPLRAGVIQPAAGALSLPDEGRRMPANQGIEAVTVVQGGRYDGAVVAFAERFLRGGHHTGWIWIGKEAQHLALKDIDGFNVTDAAGLPDGSLLVLERYFRVTEGVKMRLRHIDAGEIEPGALMIGRILVEAAGASHVIDNMEGLAVHRDGGGETVLTVIADDNFQPLLQRTVLLQFAFRDHRTGIQPPSRT